MVLAMWTNTKKITPEMEISGSYVPAMKPDTGSNDGSQEQTGLHQENGKYYYVNENGERVSDQWVTVNGKTYYISSDGYALMGMKKVDGKYYWFHTKSGYMFKNRRVTRSIRRYLLFWKRRCTLREWNVQNQGKKWGAHLLFPEKRKSV